MVWDATAAYQRHQKREQISWWSNLQGVQWRLTLFMLIPIYVQPKSVHHHRTMGVDTMDLQPRGHCVQGILVNVVESLTRTFWTALFHQLLQPQNSKVR